MSIDQARNGAWSVFNLRTKKPIAYGTFSFDAKQYPYSKAVMYIEEILDMVVKTYNVKFLVIEDIQFRVNMQAFKKLAQLQGVLVNYCEKNEYPYELVAPSSWQNYCCPNDKLSDELKEKLAAATAAGQKKSKFLSVQFVKSQFGIKTKNDNLADSLALSWYAVNNIDISNRVKNNNKKRK